MGDVGTAGWCVVHRNTSPQLILQTRPRTLRRDRFHPILCDSTQKVPLGLACAEEVEKDQRAIRIENIMKQKLDISLPEKQHKLYASLVWLLESEPEVKDALGDNIRQLLL